VPVAVANVVQYALHWGVRFNHLSGGVGSVVANHLGGGETSMVVTTLEINL